MRRYLIKIPIKNWAMYIEKVLSFLLRTLNKIYYQLCYSAKLAFAFGAKTDFQAGRNTRLNGCYIHGKKNIEIGVGCAITSGVNILDSNGHISISMNRIWNGDETESKVNTNNVWIGLNASIRRGAPSGDNSFMGVNSVVNGAYPLHSVHMRTPAKLIKNVKI